MDVDNFLKKQSETFLKASESVKESTIGIHVIMLIKRDGAISVDSLLQSLQLQIDNSKSMQGKCAPDQDIVRMQAQSAISYIQSVLRPALSENCPS